MPLREQYVLHACYTDSGIGLPHSQRELTLEAVFIQLQLKNFATPGFLAILNPMVFRV